MADVTLGGDRLGSGAGMKVELHNFGMNSFNLEQDFKSSMAPGILYPFIKMVGTNHGTFDIDLDSFVRTLPTRGPLFGSFKLQLDLYSVPFRLYNGILHNNPTDMGLQMDKVYLPKLLFRTVDGVDEYGVLAPRAKGSNNYNYQVNESALLKYLGVSGIGHNVASAAVGTTIVRKINAVPILAYYDIFKNYYANKQEENAYVITPGVKNGAVSTSDIKHILVNQGVVGDEGDSIEVSTTNVPAVMDIDIMGLNLNTKIKIMSLVQHTTGDDDTEEQTIEDIIALNYGIIQSISETKISLRLFRTFVTIQNQNPITGVYLILTNGEETATPEYTADISLTPFKLANIDKMRMELLKKNDLGEEFLIGRSGDWDENTAIDGLPYSTLFKTVHQFRGGAYIDTGLTYNAFAQNGLVVKTYQSDLFQNWLKSETVATISSMTAVDTSSGSFTMDSLNLAEKFYQLLNRIMVAGGTYQDWQDAVYGEGAVRMTEIPVYIGGMASEIMFEEVIASTENEGTNQALGSLGGKGTQVGKKGGNNIHVKLDEPGYIMGIVSITPRVCYSQGNDWDMTDLDSIDDLHKPNLDGIGFQDLMVEQMAWWDTAIDPSDNMAITRNAAGKQTAWINYQTAVDKCYGDFAKQDGYGFMVLNRNYEYINEEEEGVHVKDITTYIDPAKFNYAFAYTELDAQNFWVQIHSKVIARRKMGAQQLPNL